MQICMHDFLQFALLLKSQMDQYWKSKRSENKVKFNEHRDSCLTKLIPKLVLKQKQVNITCFSFILH